MPMTSPTGPSVDAPRLARAYTLLELILVLAVLAFVAAAAAPAMTRFARGRLSIDAAAHLLAIMHHAQDQAIHTAWPHRLEVDASGDAYRVTLRRAGVWVAPASEFGRTFDLPPGVSVHWVDSPAAEGRGHIRFDPDGSHDVARLRIDDAEGPAALIGCAGPAESYRIVAPDASELPR